MTLQLTEDQCLEALFNGVPIKHIYAPDVKDRYNAIADVLDIEKLPSEVNFTNNWFMPDEYLTLDLVEYFSDKVNTDEEMARLAIELDLFIQTDNENLLRYLIYLGTVIRDNNIITGVGRGSSVSLYVLFLCGIHRVNPLVYNLSPYDFFKIKNN